MTAVRRHARGLAAAVAITAVTAVTACGGVGTGEAGARDAAGNGEIVVFAAASLTEVFTRIGAEFEGARPGTEVTFSFGASSSLAQQILSGAPADVFAAANPATMARVVDAGVVIAHPEVFARNQLQIGVPSGNPAAVTRLTSFADGNLRIALCAQQVPCGMAAVEVFAAAGVEPAPDTYERDSKATVTKVALGEVDAALVYRTDVLAAAGSVEGIDFPEAGAAASAYPIAAVKASDDPRTVATAAAFVAFVRSERSRAILSAAGFRAP